MKCGRLSALPRMSDKLQFVVLLNFSSRSDKLKFVGQDSEISLACLVTAIAIKLDCVTGSFTRCAAIFTVRRLRARTRWVLAFLFFGHDFLLALRLKMD
jgi:hypothetical protein